MLSGVESRKKIGDDPANRRLLNEIGAISNALYLDRTRPRGSVSTVSSRSKSAGKAQFPEPKLKQKDGSKDSSEKDKKSVWSWKGLKALTHIRNRRFDCCFSLHVHSIEGLPTHCEGISFVVHWKRRDCEFMTRPATVSLGKAVFEQQLMHTCSVYGSRSGPHHSAKYEAKHFLLYASVHEAPGLDLGKHRVDLTRLLPLTLEELEDEKCSGKWTTSFRLLGKAKDARLNVSFGYLVVRNNTAGPATSSDVSRVHNLRENTKSIIKPFRQYSQVDDGSRAGSLLPVRSSSVHHSVGDIKDLHEVLPTSKLEFSDSVNMLYKKLDEKHDNVDESKYVSTEPPGSVKLSLEFSNSAKDNVGSECEFDEFSVIDHGMEFSSKEQPKSDTKATEIKSMNELIHEEETEPHFAVEEIDNCRDQIMVGDSKLEDDLCSKETLMTELHSALSNVSDLIDGERGYEEDEGEILNEKDNLDIDSTKEGGMKRSLSLDDVAESVANEFMDMMGLESNSFGLDSENDPDSPREQLLRQFEKDVLAQGYSLFNLDIEGGQTESGCSTPTEFTWDKFYVDLDQSSTMQATEGMSKIAAEAARHKAKALLMEDLETECLMRDWGLHEKTFQCSPTASPSGFGSPIDLPPELSPQLPPLGEGLGPFIQTKDGGFLRSMDPALFSNAKNGGSLIMQVSNPVVVPAEMGSGIMEILQHLASVGIEKLSMQANKLMPLEDITGKSLQQIKLEAAPVLEGPEREGLFDHELDVGQNVYSEPKTSKRNFSGSKTRKCESSSMVNGMDSEFVSLEDLAPLAMNKIEALSIEGLKVQSGMSDEDTRVNISTQSIGEFSAFEGKKRVNTGESFEGAGALQLLNVKDNGDDIDGLMGLSLTLDEWMKLDSGDIDEDDVISDRTSKILAAHHATYPELICGRSKESKKRGKGSGRRYGFLGNNFTVALMVQLRDPIRNYEPVGTPMLALVQVERVVVPPKPKIYSTVSQLRINDEKVDEFEPSKKKKAPEKEDSVSEEEGIPQFKITEVHMAGLKTEPDRKPAWGSTTQQQSGSRWLLANGMGKTNKHPFVKSKVVTKPSNPATATGKPGNTLWGISSRGHGPGAWWR